MPCRGSVREMRAPPFSTTDLDEGVSTTESRGGAISGGGSMLSVAHEVELSLKRLPAGVVEWQTQGTQNPPLARA
jgi:hypothetical protein